MEQVAYSARLDPNHFETLAHEIASASPDDLRRLAALLRELAALERREAYLTLAVRLVERAPRSPASSAAMEVFEQYSLQNALPHLVKLAGTTEEIRRVAVASVRNRLLTESVTLSDGVRERIRELWTMEQDPVVLSGLIEIAVRTRAITRDEALESLEQLRPGMPTELIDRLEREIQSEPDSADGGSG